MSYPLICEWQTCIVSYVSFSFLLKWKRKTFNGTRFTAQSIKKRNFMAVVDKGQHVRIIQDLSEKLDDVRLVWLDANLKETSDCIETMNHLRHIANILYLLALIVFMSSLVSLCLECLVPI